MRGARDRPHTAAFLVEPIQGEAASSFPGGLSRAMRANLPRAQRALDLRRDPDGNGAHGKFLACEHDNVKPDGRDSRQGARRRRFCRCSALVGTEDLMQVFAPGDHGSTFGGNPLAAAVGLAASTCCSTRA
jgi:ornithine--oxo-acid transaminase